VGSIDKQDSTFRLLNRVRMRQVALMLAVEERRTLRAAADQLGLTQPAATKMLHELESALGQPLFERAGRGLRLNAAGERVMGYFRGIRGSMEALNRELHDFQLGSVGKFSLGSIMAASPGRLTDALTELKAAHPLLAIEIAVDTSDKLLAQLHEGVLEVVVGRPVGPEAASCTFNGTAISAARSSSDTAPVTFSSNGFTTVAAWSSFPIRVTACATAARFCGVSAFAPSGTRRTSWADVPLTSGKTRPRWSSASCDSEPGMAKASSVPWLNTSAAPPAAARTTTHSASTSTRARAAARPSR